LAKLSVPLEQAEQKFTFMKPDIKRELKNKIMEINDDFGLSEIVMHSFVRQFDPQTQISATDMAYAISSLLEHPAVAEKD
jgi:CDC45-like protein